MKLAIIGGSGLENSRTFMYKKEVIIDTIYGRPSSSIVQCSIGNHDVLFLARHGFKHDKSPSEINYRANIHALKSIGATHIIATTACGSLREHIHPGDFVVPDQFIDATKQRISTFYSSFEKEMVHPPMSDPFDVFLRNVLVEIVKELPHQKHPHYSSKGTIVTIEGPRFSTRAESRMYQKWGADIIGMTTATECALANEAGIPYAAIAMVTDYDCWKEGTSVTVEAVMNTFAQNKEKVIAVLSSAVERIYDSEHETTVAYRKHFQKGQVQ